MSSFQFTKMRVWFRLAFFVPHSLLFAACAALPDSKPALSSGLQFAEQKCAGCHAIGLQDASLNPAAPALRTLYRRYPIDALEESFRVGLEVGHRDMPRFVLPASQVRSLIGYLRSIDPCGADSTDDAAMARCFSPMVP